MGGKGSGPRKRTDPDRLATGLGRGRGVFAGLAKRRTQLTLELQTTLLELRWKVNEQRAREKLARQYFANPKEFLPGQTEVRVKWTLLDRMLWALGK